MELSREFMLELVRTREFSDFTFTVPDGEDYKVHRLILSARSPALGRFFQKHDQTANLFDLFLDKDEKNPTSPDQYTSLALQSALNDVFTFCYLSSYDTTHRAASPTFTTRVLSHLLTHELAHRFEIPDLVDLTVHYFKKAFLCYCANSTSENVKKALQECSSEDFVKESGLTGHALGLLRDMVLAAFTDRIGVYKSGGRFREALELMEAVPLATAYLYSRPKTRVGERDEEEGDEVEEEGHDGKRVKGEYDETG